MSEKWEVEDCGSPDYLDGIKSQYTVHTAGRDVVAYCFEEGHARLIAAAPEMVELLARLAAMPPSEGFGPMGWLAEARALLSKIKGEEQ